MYVTVRTLEWGFFVNQHNDDGSRGSFGKHSYNHKRSARRAAKALAAKLVIPYRQDLEYSGDEAPKTIPAEAVSS